MPGRTGIAPHLSSRPGTAEEAYVERDERTARARARSFEAAQFVRSRGGDRARSRRALHDRASHSSRESGKNPETRARPEAGTHLLPWGCHTIMELVLAALPVETTGALLRTGATAERAAILTVEMCSCGNECLVWAIESDKTKLQRKHNPRERPKMRASQTWVYSPPISAGSGWVFFGLLIWHFSWRLR